MRGKVAKRLRKTALAIGDVKKGLYKGTPRTPEIKTLEKIYPAIKGKPRKWQKGSVKNIYRKLKKAWNNKNQEVRL